MQSFCSCSQRVHPIKRNFRSVVDYMMFYSQSEYFFTKAKLKHMSLKKIIKPNFGS